jgi:hypothetical protein
MRYTLISALALCALAAQAVPQVTAKRKIPCKTAENATTCYWTRGRITCCNGNPSMRMWKVGTKRILGILSGPNSQRDDAEDSLHPELPSNLARAYDAEYKRRAAMKDPDAGDPEPAFGDFEVCPLEPERPGWMQPVCIESAKNIFFQKPARR